jgi:hypothetical protein
MDCMAVAGFLETRLGCKEMRWVAHARQTVTALVSLWRSDAD